MTRSSSLEWKSLHADHFNKVPVLITGGAGFIGSHLADALIQLGAQVTIIDDLSEGVLENLPRDVSFDFFRGSILDGDLLGRCVKSCRYVFHQAAKGSVPNSIRQPTVYQEVNCNGTFKVLEAARDAGVERIMFASSGSVYGQRPLPWSERVPSMTTNPYAASKLCGEGFMRAYASSYELDTVSLRYFNVFGPRQNAYRQNAAVVPAFAMSLMRGEAPRIFGDGTQSRDFTYVANIVHANLLAARCQDRLKGEAVNVGCGEELTVEHLACQMARLLDKASLRPTHTAPRSGDGRYSVASLDFAKDLIHYKPIVRFLDGLAITTAWYAASQSGA
jgi:nucleoside-diphosphate-sugar epimerase